MANTQKLKDIRCPMCFQTQRFVIQITMNAVVEDDGFDFMASQPDDDHFPGRILDEDDGFKDDDPISCGGRYGCGHTGTVKEFRVTTQAGG